MGKLVWKANYFEGQKGSGVNCFRSFLYRGGNLFRGAFVLGGFLTGGLWLGDFCPGFFFGGLLTGYRLRPHHCFPGTERGAHSGGGGRGRRTIGEQSGGSQKAVIYCIIFFVE